MTEWKPGIVWRHAEVRFDVTGPHLRNPERGVGTWPTVIEPESVLVSDTRYPDGRLTRSVTVVGRPVLRGKADPIERGAVLYSGARLVDIPAELQELIARIAGTVPEVTLQD